MCLHLRCTSEGLINEPRRYHDEFLLFPPLFPKLNHYLFYHRDNNLYSFSPPLVLKGTHLQCLKLNLVSTKLTVIMYVSVKLTQILNWDPNICTLEDGVVIVIFGTFDQLEVLYQLRLPLEHTRPSVLWSSNTAICLCFVLFSHVIVFGPKFRSGTENPRYT